MSLIKILLVNHESVKMPSALINTVTLYTVMYTVMYIRNYKKNLNIAESTLLQNVNFNGIYFGVFGRTAKIRGN